MKSLRSLAAALLLVIALTFTSGCLPKWTVAVSRYAQSNFLYNALNTEDVAAKAADNYTFLIFDVSLTNNGPASKDIREDLLFAVYDADAPAVKFPNYYEDSSYDVFDNIVYVVDAHGTNNGSIFVAVPLEMDLSGATFKIMLPNYDVIFSVDVTDLAKVTDYPDSW